ncbi:hypothetical protein [Kitasatospora sp. MBT66]|uniref:hypothetical protein n=1 Tax=Kitasatospora sp. MBT66 TaxID=1444769 RepID=UPI00068E425D|nr:hypothetical protein [Kitasatospora sp. MBT66]
MNNPYMTEEVERLRPGPPTLDPYGNEVPGPDETALLTGCAVLPPDGQAAASTEQTEGRDQVVVVRVLFAPPGSDLRASDRIRHAGSTYQVHGLPSPFPGPLAHVAVNLREVTG